MDVVLSEDHDILSDVGYANMLHQVLRLRPGSGKFTAPVCSSWVFLPRSCNLLSEYVCLCSCKYPPWLGPTCVLCPFNLSCGKISLWFGEKLKSDPPKSYTPMAKNLVFWRCQMGLGGARFHDPLS